MYDVANRHWISALSSNAWMLLGLIFVMQINPQVGDSSARELLGVTGWDLGGVLLCLFVAFNVLLTALVLKNHNRRLERLEKYLLRLGDETQLTKTTNT